MPPEIGPLTGSEIGPETGPVTGSVSGNTRALIQSRLGQVARGEGVTILLAVESGSRAWGFPSPDSDYDVRFIYAHPRDWYVSLTEQRDVIERPIDADMIDLAGWDVRKALRLLLRSNPALYEWLVSPITYIEEGSFRHQARALFEDHANPRALAHHYHSIAQGQWRRSIEGRTQVRLKKYFYVIRPLLSLAWVARHRSAPPMQLGDLMRTADVSDAVRSQIVRLQDIKNKTPELGEGDRLPAVDEWVEVVLNDLSPLTLDLPDTARSQATHRADELYRNLIGLEHVRPERAPPRT